MTAGLDQYIADLLYDYDCVIVPQLGGFVTNYRPAKLDQRKGIALPPGKDVRFNRNLTKNDGLLTSACAEANGWNFEEAGSFVRSEVEGYLKALNDGSKVKLKKVGILYIDTDKNLRFEPDSTQNFLKQSWGFEAFALQEPVVKAAPAPKPEPKIIPMPLPEVEEIRNNEKDTLPGRSEHTKSIYWVAAATLLPFMALSVYIGMQTGFKSPGDISPADLIPFSQSRKVERFYSPSEIVNENRPEAAEFGFPRHATLFPFSFAENAVDSTGVWVNLAKVKDTTARDRAMSAGASGKYHIIAGCFGDAQNAEAYVAVLQAKGFEASILDHHKGLHRVRLASFTQYEEALNELDQVRLEKDLDGAWLLKKTMKPNEHGSAQN